MILYESPQARKLRQEEASELGKRIFFCALIFGQPISIIATISLNIFSPHDVFWISIQLLLAAPAMGAIFWLQAYLDARFQKRKWILSSKGIKFCDGTFWLFLWPKILSLEIRELEGAFSLRAKSIGGVPLGGLIVTQDRQELLDHLKLIVPIESHGILFPQPLDRV